VIDDGHWPAGKCWPTRSECAQHSQSFCFTREGSFCVPIKQAPSGSCYATKSECLGATAGRTCWLVDGGCTESVIDDGHWPAGKCWPSRSECAQHSQSFCFTREGSFCVPIKQAPSASCYATKSQCLGATGLTEFLDLESSSLVALNMSNASSLVAYVGCESWCIWVPEGSWQWVSACQGCQHNTPTPAPVRTCWLVDGGCTESVIDDGHWPAGKCWPTRSECAQHSQSFCFTREGSFCVPIKQAPSGSCYATKSECLGATAGRTCWLVDGGCTESVIDDGHWPAGKCWPSRSECAQHSQSFCFTREGSFCVPIKQAPSGSCYATRDQCLGNKISSRNSRSLRGALR